MEHVAATTLIKILGVGTVPLGTLPRHCIVTEFSTSTWNDAPPLPPKRISVSEPNSRPTHGRFCCHQKTQNLEGSAAAGNHGPWVVGTNSEEGSQTPHSEEIFPSIGQNQFLFLCVQEKNLFRAVCTLCRRPWRIPDLMRQGQGA